ncbi:MAG TPA: AMP-binding protein [Acidobacteriaceae bacterium]|jgi:long-chain acyl-CoA synthetase|nr:AMP-binding protein [Acidobacteriaceae bacterium]
MQLRAIARQFAHRANMRSHLASLVDDFVRHGKQIAVVSYPGNRRVATSYAELAHLAGRFSALLAQQKIAPGERVLLWGANSAEWVAAFFACVLRGVLVVPLDAHGSVEFATRVLADVAPLLVIGDAAHLSQLPSRIPQLTFEQCRQQLPVAPLLTPEPSLNRETPLQILFTSGTTSEPKGVVHTHGNVLASLQVLESEIIKYRKYERIVHPLRFLHTLPLSHVFGQFMGLWVPPLLAAQVHYEDNLLAAHLVERIRAERISVAAVVPRVLELLRRHLEATVPNLSARLAAAQPQRVWTRWWHFRDVHRSFGWKFWAFVSGGAALPAELELFWNTLAFALVQGYGMTETTALITLNHPLRVAQGSVGKLLPGREVRVAEDGEILVRGPMVAQSMWRKGRMEPTSDPWLATGDLAAMDASGQMHFLGRKGDVIVTAAGLNIHPTDIEEALRRQPGVRDVVVVGWDGPYGPEPVAALLLDEGNISADTAVNGAGDAALQRIVQAANQSLPEFQRVRHALRWPELEFPHTTLGKLLRRQVTAWVNTRLASPLHGAKPEQTQAYPQDRLLHLLETATGQPVPKSAEAAGDAADLTLDLHLDSLARVQLALAMEQEFGVAVSDEALAAAHTLGDLRQLVRRELEPQRPAAATVPGALAGAETAASAGDEKSAPAETIRLQPREAQRFELPYPRWPWSAPVQAARVLFLEIIVRPLVWLLAHPRVRHVAAAGSPSDPNSPQPAIYIANHVTYIDGPLLLYALPAHVRRRMAVAMSENILMDWRLRRSQGNWFFNLLAPIEYWLVTALFNVFPMPAGAGLRQSFQHAGHALDHGYNVLVFPEGHRADDGRLQHFRPGIGMLVQQSRTNVVPMALRGLGEARQQRRWLRPPGLEVVVGDRVVPDGNESNAELTERLENAVRQLLDS